MLSRPVTTTYPFCFPVASNNSSSLVRGRSRFHRQRYAASIREERDSCCRKSSALRRPGVTKYAARSSNQPGFPAHGLPSPQQRWFLACHLTASRRERSMCFRHGYWAPWVSRTGAMPLPGCASEGSVIIRGRQEPGVMCIRRIARSVVKAPRGGPARKRCQAGRWRFTVVLEL